MENKKKMNTYVKYGLCLLGFACLGGVLGVLTVVTEEGILSLKEGIQQIIIYIRQYILIEMILFFAAEVFVGEISIRKMKGYAEAMDEADDEICDKMDYQIEKAMAWGNGVQTFLAVLTMVILATTYSMVYIKTISADKDLFMLLAAFVVFILIYVYNGYWGVRVIKMEQKRNPDRKGDPASMKFTEEWVESCDEAEKELIYQSAYKTYVTLSRWVPILMVAAMLMNLLWNTGITAIVFMGVVWLVLSLTYQKNAVQKKRHKLSR